MDCLQETPLTDRVNRNTVNRQGGVDCSPDTQLTDSIHSLPELLTHNSSLNPGTRHKGCKCSVAAISMMGMMTYDTRL